MNVFIVNAMYPNRSIPLESIFGKDDATLLYKTCQKIFLGYLHPYKGCYESQPTILDFITKNRTIPSGSSLQNEYKKFMLNWLECNPDEKEKIKNSRTEWDSTRKKEFEIVSQIANKHNVIVTWCGSTNGHCGDQWKVASKDHDAIGVFSI